MSKVDKEVADICKCYHCMRCKKVLILGVDDANIYHGAHVAVQVVGRRLQEEKVLALAEHLGAAIQS